MRTRGQRAGLDRADVVRAADDLVTSGQDLSMRAVAARLGVAPNTLYSHVRDKDELIDVLLDDALGVVDAPRRGSPRHVLRTIMIGTYDALMARRGLVPLYLVRQGARGPNAHALGDVMLARLADAGLSPAAARRARHALIVNAIGHVAYDLRNAEPEAARPGFVDQLDWLLDGILAQPVRRPAR